ncbi:hypothetical protein NP224_08095 [Klebsiella michiganensis]|uniref:Aspartate transaminase n=1 Tax=Klebsiella michiganensis TaxID=1134687 RepID=A0AAX3CVG1_9ENTR|nr:hypothetical protein [Klebsiella michiganensis]UWZ75648.1 hypothetical protein NP224_08095 [Klebsiella michiganensis]
MGEISVKTGNNARNGGKNSLNRLIRCVCGKKIGPDPRNFNQRVSLGRNDLLIRTFLSNARNNIISFLGSGFKEPNDVIIQSWNKSPQITVDDRNKFSMSSLIIDYAESSKAYKK